MNSWINNRFKDREKSCVTHGGLKLPMVLEVPVMDHFIFLYYAISSLVIWKGIWIVKWQYLTITTIILGSKNTKLIIKCCERISLVLSDGDKPGLPFQCLWLWNKLYRGRGRNNYIYINTMMSSELNVVTQNVFMDSLMKKMSIFTDIRKENQC